jgi:hypothetical protein
MSAAYEPSRRSTPPHVMCLIRGTLRTTSSAGYRRPEPSNIALAVLVVLLLNSRFAVYRALADFWSTR